jgi:glycine/D-amino acid oxidase-like deaminating enzyme
MNGRAPDVIIVGGGLVGMMTALRFAEARLRVTVLESEFPGGGSTGAAMGHVVVMDDSPEQFALCRLSCARWDELAPELPARGEFDRCGTIWVAANEE